MTGKKLILYVVILMAAVIIIKEIIHYLPYFMGGAPLGIFGILNMDSKNHSVNVQVLNSDNKLLINETYKLGYSLFGKWVPEQSVQYPKDGWKSVYDRDRLFPEGSYTFTIILDNNVTQTFRTVLDKWNQVSIKIDNSGNLVVVVLAS